MLFDIILAENNGVAKHDIQSRYICYTRTITITTSVHRNADQQTIKRIPPA